MSIESRTYDTLTGATALTALTTNIFPEVAVQGSTRPTVVYYRAPGGERINALSGYADKENALVEVEVAASGVTSRRQVSEVVIDAMTASTRFTCILPDPPFDDYDDETADYLRTMQFSVWHST